MAHRCGDQATANQFELCLMICAALQVSFRLRRSDFTICLLAIAFFPSQACRNLWVAGRVVGGLTELPVQTFEHEFTRFSGFCVLYHTLTPLSANHMLPLVGLVAGLILHECVDQLLGGERLSFCCTTSASTKFT